MANANEEQIVVGSKVVFTNDYGVSFRGRTVIRIEGDDYFWAPNTAYWYPAHRGKLSIDDGSMTPRNPHHKFWYNETGFTNAELAEYQKNGTLAYTEKGDSIGHRDR